MNSTSPASSSENRETGTFCTTSSTSATSGMPRSAS